MFANSVFSRTMDMCNMTLDTCVKREEVIANNIANVDTPSYKRQEVLFEAELERALESERDPGYKALTSDSRHIEFHVPKHYSEVDAKVHLQNDTNYRNDKNNIDIEKEIADEVKNTMRYRALTTMVASKFSIIKSVIRA